MRRRRLGGSSRDFQKCATCGIVSFFMQEEEGLY
jgi:hypothetical protein